MYVFSFFFQTIEFERGEQIKEKYQYIFVAFFLVTEYDRERERHYFFNLFLPFFLIYKEGLTIFFISW